MGSEGYRDIRNFIDRKNANGESIHTNTINQFEHEVRRNSNHPIVKHHKEKYDGHFPIWAAIELFSFGMLASLYKIMKKEDRIAIAKQYRLRPERFEGWLLGLVDLRNKCAHYGRLYGMPMKQSVKLFREHSAYRNNTVFSHLLVLNRMNSDKMAWITLYNALEGLISSTSYVDLQQIGFPPNWQSVLN